MRGPRAITNEYNIYIIGGRDTIADPDVLYDLVHIIDTQTNVVSLATERLVYPLVWPALITRNNVIYAFGGWNGTAATAWKRWQYSR